MTSLTTLDLSRNQITELVPLSSLVKLTELHLDQNRVTDLSPLGTLSKLRILYVSQNPLDDVAPLGALAALEYLYVSDTEVSDLRPLSGLTGLVELDVRKDQVTDLGPLGALTGLSAFWVSHNYLDISASSPALAIIQAAQARGATVDYLSQDTPPILNLADCSATLPDTPAGSTSTAFLFVLRNTGTRALSISHLMLGGSNAASFHVVMKDADGEAVSGDNFSVPGGSAYTLEVRMHPDAAGAKSASIAFNTNDPTTPSVRLSVSGTAVVPVPRRPARRIRVFLISGVHARELRSRSGTLYFGACRAHGPGTVRKLRIVNDGTGSLALGKLKVPKGFKLLGSLPRALGPGRAASVRVQLLTKHPGRRSESITLNSNDGTNRRFLIRLSGTVSAQ